VVGFRHFGALVAKFAGHGPKIVHAVAAVSAGCAIEAVLAFRGIEAEVAVFEVVTVIAIFAVFVFAVLEIDARDIFVESLILREKWLGKIEFLGVVLGIPLIGPPDFLIVNFVGTGGGID